jgi:SNF2 family DNA or RNA helicase
MVVIDEASSFKSNKAQRWKSLKSIREHIKRIVELTGTPAPHSLLDLWPQVYLLDEGQRLGKTIGGFRERYFNPDKRDATRVFTYKPKDGAEDSVKSLLSDICISMKAEDYLDLPPQIDDMIPVVLDTTAQKAYDKLEKEALLMVDEQTIDAGSAGALTNKLLQLCNGAVYDDKRAVVKIHDCKLEAFMELVEALNGQHALVFYNFQHDRDRIMGALKKTKLRVRVFTGPQDERDWNAGKIDILLAHPASCAYGLNLQQGGHHVIWFGLNWSLELYQQANKRLHRQGQANPVIIHQLVTKGGVDEDVISSLQDKAHTQDSLLNALKARIHRAKGETA